MNRTPDDLPVGHLIELGKRWGERIERHTQETVDGAVVDHEERMHLPPRRTDPVTAVPFAGERIPDMTTCQGIEFMHQGHSLETAAELLGVDALVLERAIVDYRPPYRRWLVARGIG
jgi:hypothetical protein